MQSVLGLLCVTFLPVIANAPFQSLGIALFAVPVGLVLGAGLAERLVDRLGSALLVRVTGLASCVATALPGFAHSLPVLMAGLFLIGVTGGTLETGSLTGPGLGAVP